MENRYSLYYKYNNNKWKTYGNNIIFRDDTGSRPPLAAATPL